MSNDKSHDTPGPVPPPPPNRRSSFSQNPSFSTLFGSNKGSPPRQTAPDPTFQRRFSWSYAPPKESTSAIDDTDEIATSPVETSGLGRRLSTTASSLREALGFKTDEPTSPRQMTTVPPFSRLCTAEVNCRIRLGGNRVMRLCLLPVLLPPLLKVLLLSTFIPIHVLICRWWTVIVYAETTREFE
jgi:hypothetical protein